MSSSRQVSGMGHVGGIPPSEIIAYLTWLGIEEDEQLTYFYYLHALDSAYLRHVHDDMKKKTEKRKRS